MSRSSARNIVQHLQNSGVTVFDLINEIFTTKDPLTSRLLEDLVFAVPNILSFFSLNQATKNTTRSWALGMAEAIYAEQVEKLAKRETGYHFTALNTSIEQVELCNLERLSDGMELHAPDLWNLLEKLLHADIRLDNRRQTVRRWRARNSRNKRSRTAEVNESDLSNMGNSERNAEDELRNTRNIDGSNSVSFRVNRF